MMWSSYAENRRSVHLCNHSTSLSHETDIHSATNSLAPAFVIAENIFLQRRYLKWLFLKNFLQISRHFLHFFCMWWGWKPLCYCVLSVYSCRQWNVNCERKIFFYTCFCKSLCASYIVCIYIVPSVLKWVFYQYWKHSCRSQRLACSQEN